MQRRFNAVAGASARRAERAERFTGDETPET